MSGSLPPIDSSSRKFGRLEKREGKKKRERERRPHSYHDYVDDGFVTCRERVREQVIVTCRYRWHDACRDRSRSVDSRVGAFRLKFKSRA